MRDEADFLAAIQADPDDDDLRLVYADWLEERGDPRSEYLRVMVHLATRQRAGKDSAASRRWLDARVGSIDRAWLEAVGIRYEVVLEEIEPAAGPAVGLTLAILVGLSYPEALRLAHRAPVVVARLIREEALRFSENLEFGHFTTRFRALIAPSRRRRDPLCRVSVRLPGSPAPSPDPPALSYDFS